MIEESSLMPQHNGRSSLSSTSLVNQYRVTISREIEERIAFFYIYIYIKTLNYHEVIDILILISTQFFNNSTNSKTIAKFFFFTRIKIFKKR